MTMMKVDEAEARKLEASGLSESYARKLATKAPFRVTWGFGPFENFETEAEARAYYEEVAEKYSDGPGVARLIRHTEDGDYTTLAPSDD